MVYLESLNYDQLTRSVVRLIGDDFNIFLVTDYTCFVEVYHCYYYIFVIIISFTVSSI